MQAPPIHPDEVLTTMSMVKMYDMPIFAVDLIKKAYETDDPFEVANILDDVFDLKLPLEQVIELIQMEEDKKMKPGSYSCGMHEVFNEC